MPDHRIHVVMLAPTPQSEDGAPGSYGPNPLLADSRLEIIPSMSWGGGRGRGGHHGYARLPYPNRADEGRGSGGLGGQVGRRACLYYKLTGNRGGTHTGCDEGKRKGRGVWLYSLGVGVCVCVCVFVSCSCRCVACPWSDGPDGTGGLLDGFLNCLRCGVRVCVCACRSVCVCVCVCALCARARPCVSESSCVCLCVPGCASV